MSKIYNFKAVESKWQNFWQSNQSKSREGKPKHYVLEMFMYPSGKVHMGHVRNYTLGDVIARYKHALGFDVLHPSGWDAFGLPAENAALAQGVHPKVWTYKNIESMKSQLLRLGFFYDWSKEIATCDPKYYKHQQKMFIEFFKNSLVDRKESMVNWDPVENTVLANEQVIDGKGWRSGALVEKKLLNQWSFKITKYAKDLLKDLDLLEGWPDKVRLMQENWIGFSVGAHIDFPTERGNIKIFTTAPETLWGISFLAISAYHPIALELSKENPAIAEFIKECQQTSTDQETLDTAEKKGIDTGLKTKHPLDSTIEVPVYITNYVLMEYGTGAIFGCPYHDNRDYEFAVKYKLPIKQVIESDAMPYMGDGVMINSDILNGLDRKEAKKKIIEVLTENGVGEGTTTYRLRDWGISRQRYWGCPIPVIHCDSCGIVPVPDKDLPVILPEDVDFSLPGNPLDRHPTWKNVSCPQCSKDARRETDTLDTFVDSSWYFLRFCDPHNTEKPFDKEKALEVDTYIGGIEHAVLHLLYARFITKALRDLGYTHITEPFKRLLTQGMVCHETYKSADGEWLYPDEVVKEGDKLTYQGKPVKVGRIEKMSKSKKNVVDPEKVINTYGADAVRLFILSDTPPSRDLFWSEEALEGSWRFVNKLWRMGCEVEPYLVKDSESDSNGYAISDINDLQNDKLKNLYIMMNKTVAQSNDLLEDHAMNKFVAVLREFINMVSEINNFDELNSVERRFLTKMWQTILVLFTPIMPHLTEELWELLGFKGGVTDQMWPSFDEALLQNDTVNIAIQINGKMRGVVTVKAGMPQDDVIKLAQGIKGVQDNLRDKTIIKTIFVPDKILSFVIK